MEFYLLAMVTLQMKNIRLNQEWSLQRARLLRYYVMI
ncbi:Uncharacterised protein [Mycobacteroides abscessus]|nr:Uncharacterised protein [Mycobacteroides abscessus]